jgi:hypothetical protein
MNTLATGYVIPFEQTPPTYEEPNNASAVNERSFTYETVLGLQKSGVVQFVDEKPHCVSPLTVSYKTGRDGTIKKRLCLDGSRCINKCLKEQKVTLSHFQRALELTREQDYQVTYDLKSAYHHIKIHPSQTKFLGAAVTMPDGSLQYFVFLCLPFGLSSAVHCITKLLKSVNAFIHSKGIRHSIFLDDGRITAASKEKAEEERIVVYETLGNAGWILENKKSDQEGDASQSKEYLGFVIDTVSMTVRLGDFKRQQVIKRVWETISYGTNSSLPAKELAGTLGKIVATEPALGPVVIMAVRAAYSKLDEAVQRRGWHTKLQMDKESIDGLIFFAKNCCSFDNAPIRSAATEISVLSIIGPPGDFIKNGFVANHTRTNKENIWASDASGFATCAYSVKGDHLYFRGELSEEEKQFSSGHRELLAVKKTLDFYERTNATNAHSTNVYWLTDSQNLATFLTKGSSKSPIQKDVLDVMFRCKKMNIRIIPIHLLREDPRIKVADDGSKTTDTDDWQVDDETFQRINKTHQFTIDLFASDRNNKCQKFFSNFYCKGTSGIDAFSHSWENEVAWVCPPIREVIRTVRRLRTTQMSGVLFIPDWKTAEFWTEIFDERAQLIWPFQCVTIQRPHIIQGTFNYRSPFTRKANFNFLAIDFDSHF